MKKRYILICAAVLGTAWGAGAQNLNPTVEVTNQYEGKVMEVAKPVIDMAVPDSLLRFDLEFDYSVFDTPYKGAYTFNPYLMDARPQPDAYRGRKFYLKLGAGYPLHPVVDLVYSPELTGPFHLNVYANHYSYIGKYKVRLGDWKRDFTGYDMKTRAGVDGRYDYEGGAITFDAGYLGIHTKETDMPMTGLDGKEGLNALSVKARVRSLRTDEEFFHYDAALSFLGGAQASSLRDRLNINSFNFDATLGPVLNDKASILFDVHMDMNGYNGLFNSQTGSMYVTPKYVWYYDRWRISAGVRLSKTFHSEEPWMEKELGARKSATLYPDVQIGYEAIADRLNLYALTAGGDHAPSYFELKESNHFFDPTFGHNVYPMTDNTVNRFRIKLGLQGNIAAKFRYDIGAGYAFVRNGMLDALCHLSWTHLSWTPESSGETEWAWLPAVSYADYNLFFAEGNFTYDARPVTVSGAFRYGKPDIRDFSFGFPPASTGMLQVSYNWRDRIRAGITADGALKRAGKAPTASYGTDGSVLDVTIPAFVNLGLQGEFALTRQLSVWLQAGNLLNQNIQRHPLYPESGIRILGGVIFTL